MSEKNGKLRLQKNSLRVLNENERGQVQGGYTVIDLGDEETQNPCQPQTYINCVSQGCNSKGCDSAACPTFIQCETNHNFACVPQDPLG